MTGTADERLDFTIQVEGSSGLLVLGSRRFYGFLDVECLELSLPGLTFPLQITHGIKQLKNDDAFVRRAVLTIAQDGVDDLVRAREPLLRRAGFRNVEVYLADGAMLARSEVELDDNVVEFSCRFTTHVTPGGLRLIVSDSNVFGFIPRPGSLVLHHFCSALFGRPHDAEPEKSDLALAAGLSIGSFLARPLDSFLSASFPPAKWRIPSLERAEIIVNSCKPGRWSVEYGPRLDPQPFVLMTERVDTYLQHRAAAEALVRGDFDEAADHYETFGRQHPEQSVFISRRILEILTARRSTHPRAERVALAAIAQWPTFLPAHLALAAIAAAQGNTTEAATHFERVRYLADSAGNHEAASRSVLASARQVHNRRPSEHT